MIVFTVNKGECDGQEHVQREGGGLRSNYMKPIMTIAYIFLPINNGEWEYNRVEKAMHISNIQTSRINASNRLYF